MGVGKNKKRLEEMVNSCLLCGRCTQACAGKIPTAEHMLEMRRALHSRALPGLLQGLLSCRNKKPRVFAALVRTGLLLRRCGLVWALRKVGITSLPGLQWINHADDILPRKICRQPLHAISQPQEPTLIYLPSLEAEFFMPSLAEAVLKQVQAKYRPVTWSNVSSGLFEYVYGDVRQSRRLLRRLILRHGQLAGGRLPLLTDSIDVYLFLLRAPQLFAQWPRWQQKAQDFVQHLRFITDEWNKKNKGTADVARRVRLDSSALFLREGPVFDEARKILKTQFKKNFVECLYKDADAPAFGYSFVRHNMGQRVLMDAVRSAARTQTGTVFTLSGLSALELNFYLKQFYPYAKADHLARLNG